MSFVVTVGRSVTPALPLTCKLGAFHNGHFDAQGPVMKQKILPILALATTLLSAACQRPEPTPADTAPAATEPTPAPATETPPAAEPTPSTPAATAPTDSGMKFEEMDKNKDGGVTRDELADTEMLSQHFSAADKDGDGKLSQTEVDSHRAEMAQKPGD
jgi:hypothetical protein